MELQPTKRKLKKKAPQLIALAIALALVGYVLFELLEDTLVEGTPITSEPIIGAIIIFIENVTGTVATWGYWGIFGLMLLESSSLPVPSEVILPFAGYLVSLGSLSFFWVVVVSTIAAIIGSLIDYYIGLKGIETLSKHKILGRAVFSMEQLEFAAKWFKKYGSFAVFIARLIPGLRTIISFPAGAAKMPLVKFVAYTTAGCILWNALLIYVGYYLGINWREVAGISEYIIVTVIAVLVAIVVFYIYRRRKSKKQAQAKTLSSK